MQKIDEEKEKLTGRDERNDLGDTKKKKKKKKGKHKKRRNKRDDTTNKQEAKDNKKSALSNDQFIINGNYNLIKMLGFGAFGEIHLAYDTNTKQLRAIKFEMAMHKNPQLKHEHSILEQLNKPENNSPVSPEGMQGIPRVYLFDRMENKYNYMVMDFLGPSLSDLFQFKEKSFSLETVLMLGIQMITRIEFIHEKGFLHRDIKPENFVIGLNDKSNLVYIIDFGLSKRYKDKNTGQHIPYRENRHLVGTVRYASINAHLGIEQSRRDDIESIGYVLAYFFLGRLPWQSKTDKGKPPVTKIMEKKLITPPEILCKKMPMEFAYYFHYCKNLKFEDRPDYTTIKCLFADLLSTRISVENEFTFDWFDDGGKANEKKEGATSQRNNKLIAGDMNENEEKDEDSIQSNKEKEAEEGVTPGNEPEPISLFSQTNKGEDKGLKQSKLHSNFSLEDEKKPDSSFAVDFLKKISGGESKKDAIPQHDGEVIRLKPAIKKNASEQSFSESDSEDTEQVREKEKNSKEDRKSSGSNYGILKSSSSKEKSGDVSLQPKNHDDVVLNVKKSKK